MRSVKILKHFSYGILLVGACFSFNKFSINSFELWAFLFLTIMLWILLRLFANAVQMTYDIRAELIHSLDTIKRSINYSNSVNQEIRDLMDGNKK